MKREPPLPLVCGHRGAPAIAPENTIESFVAAAAAGASWVEFDVRPVADGRLVVHHDPVTASGVHLASTASADVPGGIPSLQQVAESCGGLGLDIELKTDDVGVSAETYVGLAVRSVAEVATNHDADIIVTSFDQHVLAEFHRRSPSTPTGLLFHDQTGDWAVATAVEVGHVAIAPWVELVDRLLVDQAHEAGLDVMTWTVNEPAEIVRVAEAGVDMIIGDDPGQIISTLAGR